MKFTDLEAAENILLYGKGKEGLSTQKFLAEHYPDLAVAFFEDGKGGGSARQQALEAADLVIVSPGIPPRNYEGFKERVTTNTNLFLENLPEDLRKKVIGVTGTKGKSTTTKFCKEVLEQAGFKVAAAGNYGVPLLDLYDDFVAGEYDWIVAELSSYQLHNVRVSPGVGIHLGLYPDHLNWHGSMEAYEAAKGRLKGCQRDGDIFIDRGSALPEDFFPDGAVFRARHWLENFGLVQAALETLSVPHLQDALRTVAGCFEGLPHRMQIFTEKRGITFVDDSIATNSESTEASVAFFGDRLGSIILGGQDRGLDYHHLVEDLVERNVFVIIYASEIAGSLLSLFDQKNYSRIKKVINIEEAVQVAFEVTGEGKVCLFSTAAPSYDQFQNFEEQGGRWQELVTQY